jgi:hypothetical protein
MPGTDSEYIPRDDESEAKRFVDTSGYGEETQYIDPEEVRHYSMADFGMDLDLGEELIRKSRT